MYTNAILSKFKCYNNICMKSYILYKYWKIVLGKLFAIILAKENVTD